MAIFNPAIAETNDPNYLGLSKSADAFEGNKGIGIALQSAAHVGEGLIKGADTVVKQELSSEIHDAVDTERGNYRSALEYASSNINNKTLLPGQDGQPTEGLPADLKSLPSAVSALTGARANGRLSETYYFGRLDSIAKDFRARFPGYREYIDGKISEITGVTPANAYIKSIIGDINAAQTSGQKDLEHTLTMVRKEIEKGNPEASKVHDHVKATGDISYGNSFVARSNAHSWRLQQLQDEQKNTGISDEGRKRAAKEEFDLTLQTSFDQHWNTIQMGLGLNTPAQISQLIEKVAAGEVQVPPQQREALLGQMVTSRAQMKQDMLTKMFKPYSYQYVDLNGQTQTGWTSMQEQLGGPDEAKKRLEASLGHWDTITNLITDEKYGLALATDRLNKAIIDEAQRGLLTDKTLGPWLKNLAAMNKIAPQYVEKYFASLLAADIDGAYKPYIMKQVSDMLAQPQYAENGIAATFKKTIEDAKNKGITMPSVYNEYVKSLEPLWRTSIPGVPAEELQNQRKNLAIAAFHPDNVGVLKSVQDDKWEDGVHKPGAQTVYMRFGQQDAVKNMRSLTDPVHWENYVAFMGSEYKTMANKELLNLNNISSNFRNTFAVSWDNDRSQWRLHQVGDTTGRDILNDKNFIPNKTQVGMAGLDEQFKQVQQSIKRLNMITKPLVNVAMADGAKDVNTVVLQHMMTSGLQIDPNKPYPGLPQQIIQQVMKARESVTPAQDWWSGSEQPASPIPTIKMPAPAPLQYTDEERRGALKDFLENPGGQKPRVIENFGDSIAGPMQEFPLERPPAGMSAQKFRELMIKKLGYDRPN